MIQMLALYMALYPKQGNTKLMNHNMLLQKIEKLRNLHDPASKKQKLVGKPGSVSFWYDITTNRYYQTGNDFNPLESSQPQLLDDNIPF